MKKILLSAAILFNYSLAQAEAVDCSDKSLFNQSILSRGLDSLIRKNNSIDQDLKKLSDDTSKNLSLWTTRYSCTMFAIERSVDRPNGAFGYIFNLKSKKVPPEKKMSDPESFLLLAVGGIKAVAQQNESGGSVCYLVKYTTKTGSPLKEFGGVKIEMINSFPSIKADDSC